MSLMADSVDLCSAGIRRRSELLDRFNESANALERMAIIDALEGVSFQILQTSWYSAASKSCTVAERHKFYAGLGLSVKEREKAGLKL